MLLQAANVVVPASLPRLPTVAELPPSGGAAARATPPLSLRSCLRAMEGGRRDPDDDFVGRDSGADRTVGAGPGGATPQPAAASVTAPRDALPTSRAYLASTPLV